MDRKRNMKLLSCINTTAQHEIKNLKASSDLQTSAKLPQYVMDVRIIKRFKSIDSREDHSLKV